MIRIYPQQVPTLAKRSVTGLPSNHSKCLAVHSPHSKPPSPNSPQRQVPVKEVLNVENGKDYKKKDNQKQEQQSVTISKQQ